MNLIKVIYLIIYQIDYLILKLKKKIDHLIKIVSGF